jgi:hypothetical protein
VYSSALLVRSCLGKGAASQQVASLSWYISGLGGLFMFVVYTKTVPWSFNISKVGNGDSSKMTMTQSFAALVGIISCHLVYEHPQQGVNPPKSYYYYYY